MKQVIFEKREIKSYSLHPEQQRALFMLYSMSMAPPYVSTRNGPWGEQYSGH